MMNLMLIVSGAILLVGLWLVQQERLAVIARDKISAKAKEREEKLIEATKKDRDINGDQRWYRIESQGDYYFEYRFRSLLNSCVGPWQKTIDEAVDDGEAHKRLILSLYEMARNALWDMTR